MKTNTSIRIILPICLFFLYISSSSIWGQDSDASTYLRDHLMVYYVEDPSSDQYRLINPNEITSGQLLFGGNPEMEIAQNLVRDIFIPGSDNDFQQSVMNALSNHNKPIALFLYYDRGPLDESAASANWTNCLENGHFTSCVTVEAGDEFAGIVHYGANQINSDGVSLAKNRLLSLLGPTSGNSTTDLESALRDGVTLTFYTGYVTPTGEFRQRKHETFEKAAEKFSDHHKAVSINGRDIIIGENAAIPVLTVQDIVDNAREILNRLRNYTNNPSLKIKTIAIMTHGLNQYVNFGNLNIIAIDENVARRKNGGNAPDAYETAQTFANALDPILDVQAKVILYACLSGSTISANDWSNRDVPRRINLLNEEISNGAEGCVARGIKDFLNENGGRREIWAHRTKGHSTGNPVWRVFKGPTVSGPLNDDNPFLNPEFGCSGNARDKLARLVKEQLNLRSIQFNEDEYKALKNWVAMEIPFVADTIWPLVSEEPTTPCRSANYVFKDGLVDWFVNKWVSQNSNTP